MISVYIGVCKTRYDERFWDSFRNFTDSICRKYSICQRIVSNTFLPDAQNEIAKDFVQSNYDYLLLLDDDHWGHTKEMLDCLVNANSYMATIKSYSRHYPYFSCLMNPIPDDKLFMGIEYGEGYIPCAMTGFPMTLLRKDLFDLLEYPYFEAEVEGGRDWVTDTVFCRRLNEIGIKPMGCFQHTLPHDHVTQENVIQLRHDHGVKGDNRYWKMVYEYIKQKGESLCMAHQ